MPLAITCGAPPNGVVGIFYEHQFPVSGGTAPYQVNLVSGEFPPGLALVPDMGILSGQPAVAGIFSFTLQATDATGATAEIPCCSISVVPPSTLTIICDNPPVATVGQFYSHTFPIVGGTGPFTFVVVTGSLPPGLTLNATTGVLSGVPIDSGTYMFAFTVGVTGS